MRGLEKLGHKIEAAPTGSAKLDEAVAAVFPSAPPNVTRSVDAVIQLIETELPGWWWTCGFCIRTTDACLYPPGSREFRREQLSNARLGPDQVPEGYRLVNHPKFGRRFDAGFERYHPGGTVPLSLFSVFLEAKITLAKAKLSTDPAQIRKEQRAAIRASKAQTKKWKPLVLGSLRRTG